VLQAHLAPAFYFLALWQLQLGPMELALENCVNDARENVHHPAPLSAIATLHAHEGRTVIFPFPPTFLSPQPTAA
jgi:hypothetical protein